MAHMRKVINKKRIDSTNVVEQKSKDFKATAIMCVAMLLIAYGFSMIIYSLSKKQINDNNIKQYTIRASETFDMPDNEYYVLFYDKTGIDALNLNVLVNKYNSSGKKNLYVVDLSKDYNKTVVGIVPNPSAQDAKSLSITNSTLIKIKDKENAGYYESILLIEKELD